MKYLKGLVPIAAVSLQTVLMY